MSAVGGKTVSTRGARNFAFWHFAAFAAPQTFVGYRTNNGQTSALSLNGSGAIDPKRT